MLQLNIKPFNKFPPKLSIAHLAPSVNKDRRPGQKEQTQAVC